MDDQIPKTNLEQLVSWLRQKSPISLLATVITVAVGLVTIYDRFVANDGAEIVTSISSNQFASPIPITGSQIESHAWLSSTKD